MDQITENTNFCRVFMLPHHYPSDFCFGGGHAVSFIMVDWFNPIPLSYFLTDKTVSKEKWELEYKSMLIAYIKQKRYFKKDRKYLVLTEFNEAFIIC